jgi:hypothetical protein
MFQHVTHSVEVGYHVRSRGDESIHAVPFADPTLGVRRFKKGCQAVLQRSGNC